MAAWRCEISVLVWILLEQKFVPRLLAAMKYHQLDLNLKQSLRIVFVLMHRFTAPL